ncbi:hypothetical protein [Chishuiella sp.]|uniref:hypothetical protein n=1 Tax=Chishuiella sp. TaxID=1969467 RepID=UPI0028A87B12|nr:hypothetical protein [Chishuiella sp.]
MKKKGLIIGKGWLGSRIENYLSDKYDFITTKRKADKENCISINFDEQVDKINLSDFEFIIITIPFGKRQNLEVLNNKFSNLINFISGYQKQIIIISSTGIYPESDNIINENSYTNEELNENYIFIEQKIQKVFPQIVILRLGGLMGDDRYLSRYLNLEKSNLNTVVNHVHYLDVCQSIEHILDKQIYKETYNVVAPLHPTKEEILEYQINKKIMYSNYKIGKIVSSNKLIERFKFEFIYNNPILIQ